MIDAMWLLWLVGALWILGALVRECVMRAYWDRQERKRRAADEARRDLQRQQDCEPPDGVYITGNTFHS